MTPTQREQLLARLLAEMSRDLDPIVAAIEAEPATSRNHYEQYIAAIHRLVRDLPKGNPENTHTTAVAIGVALVMAGANRAGVRSALEAMGHFGA